MFTAYAATAAGNVAEGTATELGKLITIIIEKIPLWIAAFVVIILSIILAKIARGMIVNKLAESGIEEEHKEVQILGGRMTYLGVLTIGITIALKMAGIDLTTIIAAVAFGIGFALKDLIMNFLAGVMILVGRQFTLGDFIKIGDTIGKVVEIQSRTTVLQAIDGTKVIVPNAELFKNQVTSFTSNPFRRIDIIVRVDFRNNLENAIKICFKAIKNTKGVLIEPKPAVLIDEIAESSINLKLKAWVDSKGGWLKIKSDLIQNVKKEFDKYGIAIPWPMETLFEDKYVRPDEKLLEEKIINETAHTTQAPGVNVSSEVSAPSGISASSKIAFEPVVVEDEQPLKPLGEL